MALKKLTELYLFNGYPNSQKTEYIKEMTDESLLDIYRVHPDMIQIQMSTIQRRFKYASKAKILNAFEAGTIQLVNSEKMTIPSSIPSWLIMKNRQIVGIGNLSLYSKQTVTSELDIDAKKLYGLMQDALITYSLYINYNKLSNNVTLMKNMAQAYSRLVVRSLDRIYSLSLDKIQADKAAYLIGKFFLLYIMDKTNTKSVQDIAKSCAINNTPVNIFNNLEDSFDPDSFGTFEGFMEELGKSVESLQYITARALLESWVRLYSDSTVLALESATYFFTMCFSSMVSAGLNNETLIQNLVSRQIKAGFNEFFRLI